jgi:hypothetical protein
MPWKVSSVMEEKLRFVFEYERDEQTMTELKCQGCPRLFKHRIRTGTSLSGAVERGFPGHGGQIVILPGILTIRRRGPRKQHVAGEAE